MHPAPSVIAFTVLSGAGLGYLALLGLGLSTATGLAAFWHFALAYALAVGGLLASTFHLGNPRRALRAFTQWRSSWLSREAWLSVAALLVMAVYASAAIFAGRIVAPIGWIGAALCLGTIFATSMIYAQMATVPRWNTPLTPACFLLAGLSGGAILAAQAGLAVPLLIALAAVQWACWSSGDRRFAQRGHSLATATGLGAQGRPRLFEPPHSGSNYLLKEFGFQVARRHAAKLRQIALACLGLLPALILLGGPHPALLALAFALHLTGASISRWLFFAEAEHVVMLYYGGPKPG